MVFGGFSVNVRNTYERNHRIPTRTLPPFPPPRGWRSFISFYSFILFICSRLVSFTIPFQHAHLVLSLINLFFIIFLFPARAEIKVILNCLYL